MPGRSLLPLMLGAALFACGFTDAVASPVRAEPFFRGMTVSTQTWGQEWGWPHMRDTLDELQGLGVTWIALHPYAWIGEDGAVRPGESEHPEYILRALEWARERGIGVMLIPHLGYWGTRFSWRGEIAFSDAAGWDRFYREYEAWIVRMAEVADRGGAALFCVGLEYDLAQGDEVRWRRIIGAVRKVYRGRLTYGAQHDKVGDIRFWDALDYIGVQAYFPLVRSTDPEPDEIRAAWGRRIAELRALSRRTGRPLVFTEIGYNASERAAMAPWEYTFVGTNAERVRERCLEAAFELEGRFPELAGMFFWKWFPRVPGEPRENFDMRDPVPMRLLRERWGQADRTAAGAATAPVGVIE